MSDEIDNLTGDEGGVWWVHTFASKYKFDLDAMTVTRFRGPTAGPTVNDGERPIRAIEECKIGEQGRWTMRSGGGYLDPDFYWQVSSVIQRIERLDGDDDAE